MDTEKRIETLEKELSELKKERDYLKGLPLKYQIAELLHGAMCHHNHTDGCGWYYETWHSWEKKGGWTNKYDDRSGYVTKAVKLLNSFSVEQIKEIVEVLK